MLRVCLAIGSMNFESFFCVLGSETASAKSRVEAESWAFYKASFNLLCCISLNIVMVPFCTNRYKGKTVNVKGGEHAKVEKSEAAETGTENMSKHRILQSMSSLSCSSDLPWPIYFYNHNSIFDPMDV